MLDGIDERRDHLRQRDQAQAARGVACRRQRFEHGVDGYQQVGPAVAGTEHVPRPHDRSRQSRRRQRLFGLTPRLLVGAHGGRRLGHADVDEVREVLFARRRDRLTRRSQIDVEELRRLARGGVGHADQLDEGIARGDRLGKRPPVEGVADTHFAPGRHLGF